jgi:hypothetical protein
MFTPRSPRVFKENSGFEGGRMATKGLGAFIEVGICQHGTRSSRARLFLRRICQKARRALTACRLRHRRAQRAGSIDKDIPRYSPATMMRMRAKVQ